MPSFTDFDLQRVTLATLTNMEITEPTPIQAEAIPALLAGKDLVGQSATGSGKTLAYGIPLVEKLAYKKREAQALVLVPTRELATQVNNVLSKLAAPRRLTTALLVGGRAYSPQISALRHGAQIVVGTPGRIKDHLDRGTLVLSQLRMCVLDEADEMLDIGFAPIIEEILLTTPETRQMALFSATMPEWIEKLQEKFLKDPVKVEITPATGAESTIEQIAYQVPNGQKMAALCTLLHSSRGESSLIFGKTKFGVERLGDQLSKLGFTVGTLHGDKSQRARDEVLNAFRCGHVQTLLATNVAARGLDIKGIYQVINYELPESSDLFTHRIGRTGRMGQQGKAITLLAPSDLFKWRRMARNLGQAVSLQKLTIDEEATTPPAIDEETIVATSLAKPEATVAEERKQRTVRSRGQEREQNNEQRPVRSRKNHEREQNSEQRPIRIRENQEREQSSEEQRSVRSRKNQEREQNSEQRPARYDRKRFAPDQERGRFVRPGRDSHTTSSTKRRQKDNSTGEIPAYPSEWQAEGITFPERPHSNKAWDSKRVTENRPSASRPASKRKAHPFAVAEPQRRTTRRKPAAAPTAHTRRTAAPKRSASR